MAEEDSTDSQEEEESNGSSSQLANFEQFVQAQREQQRLQQPAAPAQQPQPPQNPPNEERQVVMTMLASLGFEQRQIAQAVQIFENDNRFRGQYSPDIITQIILGEQEQFHAAQQKQQMLAAMELSQQKQARQLSAAADKRARSKPVVSGFRSGEVVLYRERITAQIMARMDDLVQLSWPIHKAMYQRAIIWTKLDTVAKLKKENDPSESTKSESRNRKRDIPGKLFQKLAGKIPNSLEEPGISVPHRRLKFERMWRDLLDSDILERTAHTPLPFLAALPRNFEVICAFKVHNERANARYEQRKGLIVQFGLCNAVQNLNEKRLWLPSRRSDIDALIREGVKRKFAHRTSLGLGHKFYISALSAIECAGEAEHRRIGADSDGVRYFAFASVLCGQSCLGAPSMDVPDTKPQMANVHFESACDDFANASAFTVFQDDQARLECVVCVRERGDRSERKERKRREREERRRAKREFKGKGRKGGRHYAAYLQRQQNEKAQQQRAMMEHLRQLRARQQQEQAQGQRAPFPGPPPAPPAAPQMGNADNPFRALAAQMMGQAPPNVMPRGDNPYGHQVQELEMDDSS